MIRHIVAIDSKRGIARNGSQPWKLPADEAYFGEMTKQLGGAVLMGHRTFEVIGHPLPERQNFVLTRQEIEIPGVTVVRDVHEFLATHTEDIWIIGGALVYELTLSVADELYITEIDADFDCDQFYPEYQATFGLQSCSEPQMDHGVPYRYCIYSRLVIETPASNL